MPTTPSRARRWISTGKATAFWKGGLFCVRLNIEPSARKQQPIAVGIDPGSKREGIAVASAAHTYANIQAEARTDVEGEPIVHDGPFIEGNEVIGGYVEVNVADLDEALRMAKTWPARGTVEVRPVMEMGQ